MPSGSETFGLAALEAMGRGVPVIAPCSPADCFDTAVEALRIALRHMTPVLMLSDGYVANGAEPWRIPDLSEIEEIPVKFTRPEDIPEGQEFLPYERNPETMGRHWAVPGTPELMHRINRDLDEVALP